MHYVFLAFFQNQTLVVFSGDAQEQPNRGMPPWLAGPIHAGGSARRLLCAHVNRSGELWGFAIADNALQTAWCSCWWKAAIRSPIKIGLQAPRVAARLSTELDRPRVRNEGLKPATALSLKRLTASSVSGLPADHRPEDRRGDNRPVGRREEINAA